MTTSLGTRPSLPAWRIAVFVVFAINGLAMATWFARTPAVRDALDVRTDEFGFLIMGMAGGSIIGAIGVSGAPTGDADDACAKAGIAAIRDELEL